MAKKITDPMFKQITDLIEEDLEFDRLTEVHKCDECERSVVFGSGLYIDRVSTDDGWICMECQVDGEGDK